MNFSILLLSLFGKMCCPSMWKNLNSLHPIMFGWNWPCSTGSGEENFQNSSMYFGYFVIISPWLVRYGGLHFDQTWIPFNQTWPTGCERNYEKFITTTTTDNGQIVIRKAHLGLWLKWAKTPTLSFSLWFKS